MTPLFVTDAALELTSAARAQQYQITHFQKPALSENAPWLYSALAQLHDVVTSGELIPGFGDFRIRDEVARRARLMLSLITLTELPAPSVRPISGGGLSIDWEMGNREVKFSFVPDGRAFYLTTDNDEILGDGPLNLASPDSAQEPLRWISMPRP